MRRYRFFSGSESGIIYYKAMDILGHEKFKYEKRYWYPHMGPEDAAIWERFIERYPDAYDYCWYDLEVGTLSEVGQKAAAELGGNTQKLYRKKIDVVAAKDDQFWVIELKPKAGASAVGQVKMYRALLKKEFPNLSIVGAKVVTDAVSDETR